METEFDFTGDQLLVRHTGDTLKEQGMERALFLNLDWKYTVLSRISLIADTVEFFTMDDIRNNCKDLIPTSGKAWGGVMSTAAKMGVIKKTGRYIKSSRVTNHSRPNAEWTKA